MPKSYTPRGFALYDENTGTRGKFHTSYYKENWIALRRRAIEKVDNDPIK